MKSKSIFSVKSEFLCSKSCILLIKRFSHLGPEPFNPKFNENYVIQFLILLITYVILDFVSLIGYAILANNLITWIKTNPKVINTISACVLIIIAIIIVFTQQF